MAYYNQYDQDSGLARLFAMGQQNQNFTDAMYRKQMNEQALEQQQAVDKAREDKLNWADDAEKGAAAGSAAGPWGALAGLIAGTVKGSAEAFSERRKEGQGFGKALFSTLLDDPLGISNAMAKGVGYKGLDLGHSKAGSGIGAGGLGGMAGMFGGKAMAQQQQPTGYAQQNGLAMPQARFGADAGYAAGSTNSNPPAMPGGAFRGQYYGNQSQAPTLEDLQRMQLMNRTA